MWIADSIILTDEPFDFKIDQTYHTKFLGLKGTGKHNRSRWAVNKKQLSDILRAIAKSGLKSSLSTINVNVCEIGAKEVQKAVDKLGMKNVIVSDQFPTLECNE